MSRERLDQIREIDQEVSSGFAIEDLDLNTMTVVNRKHFEWLIEQAERAKELESEREEWELAMQVLQDRVKELESNTTKLLTDRYKDSEELDESNKQNKRYREVIQESNVIFAEAIESIDLGEKVNGLYHGVKITYEALEGESE